MLFISDFIHRIMKNLNWRTEAMKTLVHYLLPFLFLLTTPSTFATESNRVVATMNVGITPAGIAITSNSRTAYVANNNNYSLAGEDSVSVLNLENNTLKATIFDPSFNEPYTITLSVNEKKAYVTNSNSTTISIINTAENTVTGIIDGFDGPSGMVITPDGKKGYINNYGGPEGVGSGNSTTVRVVDLKTDQIVGAPITVGLAPAALAITPNGKYVYVINYVDGNQGTGTISIIDTRTDLVVGTITGFSGPFAIAITPNGKYAVVTNFGSNNFDPIGTTVSIVRLKDNKLVANVEAGIQPSGLAITPDSRFAYITNYNTLYAGANFTKLTPGEGTVNIIDIEKKTLLPPTIVVGQSPHGVAISPNGKYAYTSNYTANTLTVIALPRGYRYR